MTNTELTAIRESLNLSKSELAAQLGTTALLIGRYESGSIAIPDYIAEKIQGIAETSATTEPMNAPEEVGENQEVQETKEDDFYEENVIELDKEEVEEGIEVTEEVKETTVAAESTEEDIPSFIKSVRTALKLSRAKFADLIGVSMSAVSFYESGKSKPRKATLEKIKELANTPLDKLTETAPKPTQQPKVEVAEVHEIPEEVEVPVETEEVLEAPKPENKVSIYFHSNKGGFISVDELLKKMPDGTTAIYINVEENSVHWVKGESGSLDL